MRQGYSNKPEQDAWILKKPGHDAGILKINQSMRQGYGRLVLFDEQFLTDNGEKKNLELYFILFFK